MESWLRRNSLRIAVLAIAASLAFAGVVLASGSGSTVPLCIASKEGKPIVSPKAGACKTGYTLTEVNKEGREGKEGPQGREGTQGREGPQGKEGPFPSTLPHGDTVTGTWGVTNGNGSGSSGSDWGTSAISFPYRLASAPTAKFVQKGKTETGCTGTASNPTAESGYLCVYEGISTEVNLTAPELCGPVGGCKEGASTVGVEVRIFGVSGTTRWYDWGTWAVTG